MSKRSLPEIRAFSPSYPVLGLVSDGWERVQAPVLPLDSVEEPIREMKTCPNGRACVRQRARMEPEQGTAVAVEGASTTEHHIPEEEWLTLYIRILNIICSGPSILCKMLLFICEHSQVRCAFLGELKCLTENRAPRLHDQALSHLDISSHFIS